MNQFEDFLQNHKPRGGKLEWTHEDMKAAFEYGLYSHPLCTGSEMVERFKKAIKQ